MGENVLNDYYLQIIYIVFLKTPREITKMIIMNNTILQSFSMQNKYIEIVLICKTIN